MSQSSLTLPTTGTLSGGQLVNQLNSIHTGLATWLAGATAPTASSLGLGSLAGVVWHDTTAHQIKMRDQTDSLWITLGTLDETNKIFIPAGQRGLGLGLTLDSNNNQTLKLADNSLSLTSAGLAMAATQQVPVRQTVLAACGDSATGTPWLVVGGTASVSILATAVPVRIAFAAGCGANGAVDYVGSITADVSGAWSNFPGNATCYLYVERNSTTGVLSYGMTAVRAPAYLWGSSASVVRDEHSYRIDQGVMMVGDGTTTRSVQRVFVGEVQTTASGTISSLICYALCGRAANHQGPGNGPSGFSAPLPAAATKTSFNDGLGTCEKEVSLELMCVIPENGYNTGDIVDAATWYVGGAGSPIRFPVQRSSNSVAFTTGQTYPYVTLNATTGANCSLNPAGWGWRLRVKRNF